jgi:hypothetical protein
VIEASTITYNLPATTDPENTTCNITLVSGPGFAILSGTTMTFNPATGTAGSYPVILKVSDGFNTP